MSRAQGPTSTMRGFTLIELMIVVVIVAVLAAVAGVAYRKYADSGRTAEAMAMLGEFRAKEEAFRAENSAYLSTTASGEDDFYPALGSCPGSQTEPCPKALPDITTWAGDATLKLWLELGIRPNRSQLYCGYVAVAGAPNQWGLAGTDGKALLGATAPTVAWYYLRASCDNNSTDANNTTFVTAFNNTTVVTENEHE